MSALPTPAEMLDRWSRSQQVPWMPPSAALAAALNQGLLPRLPAEVHQTLLARPLEIQVTDLGLVLRLELADHGFQVAPARAVIALRLAATAPVFWQLLHGLADIDRLLSVRSLLMEGDTEMIQALKKTLTTTTPLRR